MKGADSVRWTISVPKETDVSLRTYLAEAVRWRLFDLNVSAARVKNSDSASNKIENSIEQALMQVRAARSRTPT